MIIHSYNRYSRSAKAIRLTLKSCGVKCRPSWRGDPKDGEYIINWGDSDVPFLTKWPRVLNRPKVVAILTNKLRFFQYVVTGVVPWTTDAKEAKEWDHVFCRTRLEGTGGDGIVVWNKGDGELPKARLYTKRIFGKGEWRIHIARDPFDADSKPFVLDAQAKIFQKGEGKSEPKSWAVRSHDNGFVFVRNVPPPKSVTDSVLKFVTDKFPDLDFAAFDVILGKDGKTYILEGNTAPGLEGETVRTYCNFFSKLYKKEQNVAM